MYRVQLASYHYGDSFTESPPSKDNLFYNLHNITTPYTSTLFKSKFKNGSPHPASESPSNEETTNVPRSDCSSADDLSCLDTSSNIFTLDFCNIRDLRSNF